MDMLPHPIQYLLKIQEGPRVLPRPLPDHGTLVRRYFGLVKATVDLKV